MSSDSPKDVESGKNLVFGKILRFPGLNWAKNGQVLRSGYLPFSTLPGRYTSFFWLGDPIGPNFRGFGAITPANNVGFG